MRAQVQVEEGRAGRLSLVATQIPFQVNKAMLLERIADMVRDGKLTGISDLRDESDRDGMRIVIELKKDANPKVVLNQLFVHTPLQSTFGAIMLGLVKNRPQVLTLRALLDQYVLHRQVVVRRRTEFDLAEAERRAHILEGLKIALDHLDAVIALIRAAKDVETARSGLMAQFKLSEIQANAILEMRLQRLTGLERAKIEQEYLEVIQLIEKLRSILASEKKMLAIIQDEVRRLKEKYGDERRTVIVGDDGEIGYEDTIEQKDMVITISHAGYIKRQEVTAYRSQRRGGKGVIGARTKEEDYIEHLFVANTHAYLLILTDKGRCYWLKVHEVEQAGRMARGRPLVNHLEGLSRDERVQAVVAVKEFDEQHFLVCATRKGLIKKTVLSAYSHPRKAGINAVLLEEGDGLIDATITDGSQDVILAKKKGLAIRFHESEVRPMGRTAYGVKAVTLDDAEDEVVSMVGVKRQATLLAVTEHGYGKRSEISEYRVSHRGGKGIITIKTTERNGNVVTVKEVVDGDELMIITRAGQMIRMPVQGISVLGRNTQGVRLVNLQPAEGEMLPDAVSGVTRVVSEDDGVAPIAANGAEPEAMEVDCRRRPGRGVAGDRSLWPEWSRVERIRPHGKGRSVFEPRGSRVRAAFLGIRLVKLFTSRSRRATPRDGRPLERCDSAFHGAHLRIHRPQTLALRSRARGSAVRGQAADLLAPARGARGRDERAGAQGSLGVRLVRPARPRLQRRAAARRDPRAARARPALARGRDRLRQYWRQPSWHTVGSRSRASTWWRCSIAIRRAWGRSSAATWCARSARCRRRCARRTIDIGVIATPIQAAQEVADALVAAGVRGILNFAPRKLFVPAHVALRNVDMAMEFESLSFAITHARARRGRASG